MPARHLNLGAEGEDAAAAHVADLGWRVLARNWRHAHLELDLVAEDKDGVIVFVEVKTRSENHLAAPDQVLSPGKRGRVVKAAAAWLSAKNRWCDASRFDLITVIGSGESRRIEHLKNAFELSDALGCCDAAWQPW